MFQPRLETLDKLGVVMDAAIVQSEKGQTTVTGYFKSWR